MPDAYVFALVATIVSCAAALVWGRASIGTVIDAWGNGFWDLLGFTMQMSLVIVTGHVLATSAPLVRFIAWLADKPHTAAGAVSHGLATYDPDVVQGTVLDRDEVDRQLELYRSRSADERRGIAGLQPGRAEVILAGACVIRTVLDTFGKDSLTVSDRGLRYGVLAERFG